MEVSEEGFPGHPLPLQFRERSFGCERSHAMGAMRRDTYRWIVREYRLSAIHVTVEDIEHTTALKREASHRR